MRLNTCLQLYRSRFIRPFFRSALERRLIFAIKTGDIQQNITLLVASLGVESDVRISRDLIVFLAAFSEEELAANAAFVAILSGGPLQNCSPHEALEISRYVLVSCLHA